RAAESSVGAHGGGISPREDPHRPRAVNLGLRSTAHLRLIVTRLSGHDEQASLAFAQLENVTASFQASLFGVKAMHEGHVASVERVLSGRRRGRDGAVPSLD